MCSEEYAPADTVFLENTMCRIHPAAHRIMWKPIILFRAHKSQLLVPKIPQIKAVHIFHPIHSIFTSISYPIYSFIIQFVSLLYASPLKQCTHLSSGPIRAKELFNLF